MNGKAERSGENALFGDSCGRSRKDRKEAQRAYGRRWTESGRPVESTG